MCVTGALNACFRYIAQRYMFFLLPPNILHQNESKTEVNPESWTQLKGSR